MKNETSADTLQFSPHFTGPVLMNKSLGRKPHSFYKAALFLNDIFLSIIAFSGCILIFGDDIELVYNFSNSLTVVIFAMVSIAFFNSSKLYNYHIIYDARRHMKQRVDGVFLPEVGFIEQ